MRGKGGVTIWPDQFLYSIPFWKNSVSTLLTVTSDLGIDLPREIREKSVGFS